MNKKNVDKKVNIKNKKEQFEEKLNEIKEMNEAIELHNNVKEAVLKEEVDYNYLRYVENKLEDIFFENTNTKGLMPKIILEIICPNLIKIENFDASKLQIENIGSHFEEQENYIDKICIYNNTLVCVFGISEMHPNKVLKYEPRKFSRVDMINAIESKYKQGKKLSLFQYDEYYVCVEEDKIKVFSERKITALVKVQETIFDKIKDKISNIFMKKKTYPDLHLVFDSNPDRLTEFEHKTSKFDAKSRMKLLLNREREITRI